MKSKIIMSLFLMVCALSSCSNDAQMVKQSSDKNKTDKVIKISEEGDPENKAVETSSVNLIKLSFNSELESDSIVKLIINTNIVCITTPCPTEETVKEFNLKKGTRVLEIDYLDLEKELQKSPHFNKDNTFYFDLNGKRIATFRWDRLSELNFLIEVDK